MTDKNNEIIEIDLLRLVKALWHRAWLIVLAAVLGGVISWGYTQFFVTPTYQSSVLMYVNYGELSLGGNTFSVTKGSLGNSKSLIDTYSVILKTRLTLNEVAEEAELDLSAGQLMGMISAASVNGTEVFRVTVTDSNPERAALIANTVARVLPEKISSIIEGTSARVVDAAVPSWSPTSPNYSRNTLIGILIGMILACGIVILQELMDDKVYDTDYLIQTYKLPVLAVVPDLMRNQQGNYGSYYANADKSGKR